MHCIRPWSYSLGVKCSHLQDHGFMTRESCLGEKPVDYKNTKQALLKYFDWGISGMWLTRMKKIQMNIQTNSMGRLNKEQTDEPGQGSPAQTADTVTWYQTSVQYPPFIESFRNVT